MSNLSFIGKRFLFGRSDPDDEPDTGVNNSNANDDAHSVHSESSITSDMSWITSDKNIFMNGIRRLGGSMDSASIDGAMRNLYQDADILEEKCKQSLMGNEGKRHELLSMSSLRKHRAEEDARGSALKTHKKPQEVIDRLPAGFFAKDYDPVEKQLHEVSSWQDLDLTERFMVLIEEADTDKDMVLSRLASMIEASHGDLMKCMRDVHAIDLDLAYTGVQMTNCRRKLKSAQDLQVSGSMRITRMSCFRSRLEGVRELLAQVKRARDLFHGMQGAIRSGDTLYAAECAMLLLQLLQSEAVEQLEGVQNYGVGVQELIPLIRRRTDSALFQICSRRFIVDEYCAVLRSYLLLDSMRENTGVQISGPLADPYTQRQGQIVDEEEALLHDAMGCMEGLCSRISRYLQADVSAAIRITLIEQVHALQVRRFPGSGSGASTPVTQDEFSPAYSALVDCPLQELYERLPPETMVTSVVRACELLVELVHTMFQILQWHRSPFDPRNAEPWFVHRGPSNGTSVVTTRDDGVWATEKLDDDDKKTNVYAEDGDVVDGISSPRNKLGTHHGSGGYSADTPPCASFSTDVEEEVLSELDVSKLVMQRQTQFEGVYSDLLDGRRALWETVQRGITELLESLTPSVAVSVDDFLCMIWALQKLVRLGKEFCGVDSSNLQSVIKTKSVEFISELHREYFQRLRQMVEAETWRSVPVRLGETGGIKELLKSNLQKEGRSVGREALRLRGMLREASEAQRRRHEAAQLSGSRHASGRGPGRRRSSTRAESGEAASVGRGGAAGPDAKPQQGGDGESVPLTDKMDSEAILTSFHIHGNPLQPVQEGEFVDGGEDGEGSADLLSSLFDDDLVPVPTGRRSAAMIVTQSALNGLTRYTAKYLQLMHVLRSVSADVLQGLSQLFDFYLCAVFNCFVPSEQRQRCLSRTVTRMAAPAPCQSKDFEALQQCMQRALAGVPAGASYSPGDRDHVDAEGSSEFASSAVASLSSQLQQTGILFAKLLPRAPATVEAPAEDTLYALNEHIVAAESCWFAAKLLDELKPKLQRLLDSETDSAFCESYVSEFSLVAGQLRALVYKSMCPRLIGLNWSTVIAEKSEWDVKRMREDPHDWVDSIVGKCKDVWQYMTRGEEFADASSLVREQVWMELCQTAFDMVLDGLARVRKVSTEGRACMAMDLSALHSGLDAVHPCRPPRGKLHVDNFVRASYLSEDEVLEWVRNNWQAYAYRHLHGLLHQASSSANTNLNVGVMKKKRLTTALSVLDSLHDEVMSEDAARDTGDLSSKLFGKRFS